MPIFNFGTGGSGEKYTHPTTPGNKHIPSGGSANQILGWQAGGTAKWQNPPQGFLSGKTGAEPEAASNAGKLYLDTDRLVFEYCDGTSWNVLHAAWSVDVEDV